MYTWLILSLIFPEKCTYNTPPVQEIYRTLSFIHSHLVISFTLGSSNAISCMVYNKTKFHCPLIEGHTSSMATKIKVVPQYSLPNLLNVFCAPGLSVGGATVIQQPLIFADAQIRAASYWQFGNTEPFCAIWPSLKFSISHLALIFSLPVEGSGV